MHWQGGAEARAGRKLETQIGVRKQQENKQEQHNNEKRWDGVEVARRPRRSFPSSPFRQEIRSLCSGFFCSVHRVNSERHAAPFCRAAKSRGSLLFHAVPSLLLCLWRTDADGDRREESKPRIDGKWAEKTSSQSHKTQNTAWDYQRDTKTCTRSSAEKKKRKRSRCHPRRSAATLMPRGHTPGSKHSSSSRVTAKSPLQRPRGARA